MSSELESLPVWASELLSGARVARLGMVDGDGQPRVQPVTFALSGERIWSAVDAKPKAVAASRLARVRFLRAEPRVALTVDEYAEDWRSLAWVQVLARASIVPVSSSIEALRALVVKYPQYRETQPEGPLVSLLPTRCLWWRAAG